MKGWICYPIWGLEMADNGHGVDHPIFGDATIIPTSYVRKHVAADPIAAALMSGGGLRAALESSPVEMAGPAPTERLIDIPPGAFIAVRRQNPEDAARYADSIRTFLTATSILTSGTGKGFSLTPLPLQWSALPSQVRLNGDGLLESQYRVVANIFIHLTPVVVTRKQFLDSWEFGTPIQGTWSIHKDGPLSKVFVGDGNALSGLRRRIRDAGSTLARAMESTDAAISTVFGVVAIETLLKGYTDFKELEDMATSIFESEHGPAEITRLFSNRHKVAHEAQKPSDEAQHSQEIGATWALILLSAMASEELTTVPQFVEHLRGRVLARRMAKNLREKGEIDLAEKVELAATILAKKR